MAAVFSPQRSLPSENWDDDFEFHQSSSNTSNNIPSSSTRISAASEDWDKDDQSNDQLWSQPGPSTPAQRPVSHSTTENWDDDFEDKTDSPGPSTTARSNHPRTRSISQRLQEPESWDDEFELPPVTPTKRRHEHYPSEDDHATDDDDDDDDMDFGFADKEEDRTVTAHSRRTTLSRLSNPPPTADLSPPPPVPPIPISLLTASTPHHEQPFPRSPTASVFSAPSSGRDSVAYSYYHNNSTTHLRPMISRSSVGGLANLPPSPPIHKERERRRLRKKSRPHPEAVYELSVRSSSEPMDIPAQETENTLMRTITPSSPSTPPQHIPTSGTSNRLSINANVGLPSSPPNKTPLLSRIGSVKKWGARRKRASATPSEVALQEMERERQSRADSDMESNENTPRPPSSLAAASSPPSKPSWFFRATSGGGSSPDRVGNDTKDIGKAIDDSPTKLIKKKSFGFMPLRSGKGPINDGSLPQNNSDLPSDLEMEFALGSSSANGSPRKKKRHLSQQINRPSCSNIHGQSRHASYAGAKASAENLPEEVQERTGRRSASRSRSRGPSIEEKEGSRSFMGNVRRISLVGRHKRTKSSASAATAAPPRTPSRKRPPEDAMHVDHEEADGTKTPSRSRSRSLLPPIELQPPSPPRVTDMATVKNPPMNVESTLLPPLPTTIGQSPSRPNSPSKVPSSLGRSASASNPSLVPRRNSLGDLKIPARISQAQVGLRRDLGMVRDFASHVERLKELQSTYNAVVMEVQNILDVHVHSQAPSRATSPSFFNLSRPKSRSRSNTTSSNPGQSQPAYKQLASSFYTINSKYRMAWECAELLIDLGGGSTGGGPSSSPSPPPTSVSAPAMATSAAASSSDNKRARERAITLNGDDVPPLTPSVNAPSDIHGPSPPLASPPSLAWRASTGRHDLSQRQLLLLREMLNNPDSSFVAEDPDLPVAEESNHGHVNREWRWGDAMNSTVTLPSEEDAQSPAKPRRASKLALSSLRDLLKSLKKASSEHSSSSQGVPPSSTSLSTDSSVDSRRYAHGEVRTQGRRRAKTSSGPESMRSTKERDRVNSPYMTSLSSSKASPQRPSLASIFRIGQKPKMAPSESFPVGPDASVTSFDRTASRMSGKESNSTGEDEDWDRLDSAGDIEGSMGISLPSKDLSATIRGGKSPYLSDTGTAAFSGRSRDAKITASNSQSSLWAETSPRPTRLSNVEEHLDDVPSGSSQANISISTSAHFSRIQRGGKTGSVRSMPPQASFTPDAKLAMTPENIKPLLENAKDIRAKLTECINEIRSLLVEHQAS